MFDRFAFELTGPENRYIFMEALTKNVYDNMQDYIENKKVIEKIKTNFIDYYQKRQSQYEVCDIVVIENDKSNFTNTVGWKFSEIINKQSKLEDMSKDNMVSGIQSDFLVSYEYLGYLKYLEIKEFFLGYK